MNIEELIDTLRTLNPIEVSVLKGLITGDGNLGEKMASSYPDARSPIEKGRKKLVEKLANTAIEHDISLERIEKLCMFAIENENTQV